MDLEGGPWAGNGNTDRNVNTEGDVVDEWLIGVLQNPRNRDSLGKLEEMLDKFVSDASLQYLDVPPKTAFGRKIVHHVAARYNLDNRLSAANGSETNRGLVLIKTEATSIPKMRLSELDPNSFKAQPSASEKQESSTKALFLRRKTNCSSPVSPNIKKTNSGTGKIRGVTDEEYARVRARIFQKGSSGGEEGSEQSGDDDLFDRAAATAKPSSQHQQHQPLPPIDGQRGFTRRMNHVAGGDNMSLKAAEETAQPSAQSSLSTPAAHATLVQPSTSAALARSEDTKIADLAIGNGKQRAKREDDMFDPDFDRNIQRWQQPPHYFPMQQPRDMIYPGPPAVIPPGMMGAGALGLNWMQPTPKPTNSDERIGLRSGALLHHDSGFALPGGRVAPPPFMPHHHGAHHVGLMSAEVMGMGASSPQYQERQALSAATNTQRPEPNYETPKPPTDYCNIHDFPPLGRTASASPGTDKTGASLAWEGRV